MTGSDGAIRVVIVDDQELVRKGFAMLLGAAPGITVVGEADDGGAGLELLSAVEADVVLMDLRMRGMDGVAATAEITRRFSRIRVLMLTTFDDDAALASALDAGASGFLLKDCRAEELIGAIHAVHDGNSVIDPVMTRRLVDQLSSRPGGITAIAGSGPAEPTPTGTRDPRLDSLTPREIEVLTGVGHGLSNGEISAELFLAEATVKTHLARIMHKLAVRDRVHLVLFAHASGLVDLHRRD